MRRERHDGWTLWIGVPVPPGAAGWTLGRHVMVRNRVAGDERLLRHELEHVRQYREHGVVGFLARYARDYLRLRLSGWGHWDAYRRIPFEVEAEWRAQRAVRTAAEPRSDGTPN